MLLIGSLARGNLIAVDDLSNSACVGGLQKRHAVNTPTILYSVFPSVLTVLYTFTWPESVIKRCYLVFCFSWT